MISYSLIQIKERKNILKKLVKTIIIVSSEFCFGPSKTLLSSLEMAKLKRDDQMQ